MRITVWSIAFATQTDPAPTATPAAPRPVGTSAVTRPLAGSMRRSRSASWLVTQTPPAPTATSLGAYGKRIVCASRPVPASIRQRLGWFGSPITQVESRLTASPEKNTSARSSVGLGSVTLPANPAPGTKRRTRPSGTAIHNPDGPTATRAEAGNASPVNRLRIWSSCPFSLCSRAMFASCGPFDTTVSSTSGEDREVGGLPVRLNLQRSGLAGGIDPPDGSVVVVGDPDAAVVDSDRRGAVADADGALDAVRRRIDPDEPARGGRSACAAACEEVGEQRGREQNEPGDGKGIGPACALRVQPERAAGDRDELDAGRVTLGRVLRERLGQHVFEARRCGRSLLEVCVEGRDLGAAPEGRRPGEALVEDAGERVLVGATVDLVAADLFGRNVVARPERADGVQRRCHFAERPGQTEVGEVDVLVLIEEQVRGLDVAVDEPARVCRVERSGSLLSDPNRTSRFQRALAEHLLQVGAVDEAHRDVQLAVDLAGVVNGDDIRVLERRRQPRLAQEALPERSIRSEVRGKQLQCDVAVEREIARAVDDPHPAAADDRLDPVPGELGADA